MPRTPLTVGAIVAALLAAALLAAASAHAEDDIVAEGTFAGASGHDTRGAVTIQRTEDGLVVILGEDFFHDGAPDPRVGLGVDGAYDEASDMGALEQLAGTQTYVVPDGVEADAYDEVYIWCRQYSVPLGVAAIE